MESCSLKMRRSSQKLCEALSVATVSLSIGWIAFHSLVKLKVGRARAHLT